jgi:hypothetical protein
VERYYVLGRLEHGPFVRMLERPAKSSRATFERRVLSEVRGQLAAGVVGDTVWLWRDQRPGWVRIVRDRSAKVDSIGLDACDVWTLGGFLGDCFTGDDLSRLTANIIALAKDITASKWGNAERVSFNEFLSRYNAFEREMRENAVADFSTIAEQVAVFRAFEAEYEGWRKKFVHAFGQGSSSGDPVIDPPGSGGFFESLGSTAKSLSTLLLIGGAVWIGVQVTKR